MTTKTRLLRQTRNIGMIFISMVVAVAFVWIIAEEQGSNDRSYTTVRFSSAADDRSEIIDSVYDLEAKIANLETQVSNLDNHAAREDDFVEGLRLVLNRQQEITNIFCYLLMAGCILVILGIAIYLVREALEIFRLR